ncbi:uncharacterized protein NECHADRAFT_88692 [Fusarium vanettenii 77-13-4]|uniref:Uncharacterized protein n=1 Tax=Fusarium vanettenii (strain ATCC MYA-4622 / CBS 123669 / FGSC 9596 / NRRL 45880 / 77-13-4) TaxID=660122 RepID=C7ZLJ0_FUSV7|nr:uncharacterized protein NECHADRAFT_88692 [Fusarium vanettenii 77-13-4]EEU35145.1 predicted protein [Fusarium vanettenii 77-13-4]
MGTVSKSVIEELGNHLALMAVPVPLCFIFSIITIDAPRVIVVRSYIAVPLAQNNVGINGTLPYTSWAEEFTPWELIVIIVAIWSIMILWSDDDFIEPGNQRFHTLRQRYYNATANVIKSVLQMGRVIGRPIDTRSGTVALLDDGSIFRYKKACGFLSTARYEYGSVTNDGSSNVDPTQPVQLLYVGVFYSLDGDCIDPR